MGVMAMKDLCFNDERLPDVASAHKYIVERDVLSLMSLTAIQMYDFEPSDEDIAWLDRQLKSYCSLRVRPRRFFPGVSVAGQSFYEIVRNYLGFGCAYQIVVSNLDPGVIQGVVQQAIAIDQLRTSTEGAQRKIYFDAVIHLNKNPGDVTHQAVRACTEEVAKIFRSEKFILTTHKMCLWIDQVA